MAPKKIEGTKERTTIFIESEMLEKLRYIGYKEDVTRTEIVITALTDYITKYEKKNGSIPTK